MLYLQAYKLVIIILDTIHHKAIEVRRSANIKLKAEHGEKRQTQSRCPLHVVIVIFTTIEETKVISTAKDTTITIYIYIYIYIYI